MIQFNDMIKSEDMLLFYGGKRDEGLVALTKLIGTELELLYPNAALTAYVKFLTTSEKVDEKYAHSISSLEKGILGYNETHKALAKASLSEGSVNKLLSPVLENLSMIYNALKDLPNELYNDPLFTWEGVKIDLENKLVTLAALYSPEKRKDALANMTPNGLDFEYLSKLREEYGFARIQNSGMLRYAQTN